MKMLVIGSGGREDAISKTLVVTSPEVEHVYVAPGNGGSYGQKKISNVDISVTDINGLLSFAQKENIKFTIVGPELPLSMGIVDHFQANNLKILGPTMKAARLESSKMFAKSFMRREGIPTPPFKAFNNIKTALDYLDTVDPEGIVIKANGLAAGKGVILPKTTDEAKEVATNMMEGKLFGDAGRIIIVEERLKGREASFIILTNGKKMFPFQIAQDYKRLLNNDQGPNTGGMGGYSPVDIRSYMFDTNLRKKIVNPTLKGMEKDGTPYVGFLYFGLIIDEDDKVKVLEYNVRLGDPEAQILLPRIKRNFAGVCYNAVESSNNKTVSWDNTSYDAWGKPTVGVVMVSDGYPDGYKTGHEITGLDEISKASMVFHSGTKEENGKILTNGGRVLTVVSSGNTVEEARRQVYTNVSGIHFKGCQYRYDIAFP